MTTIKGNKKYSVEIKDDGEVLLHYARPTIDVYGSKWLSGGDDLSGSNPFGLAIRLAPDDLDAVIDILQKARKLMVLK